MPKLYDSFLFFQELDLLELRLKYLNSKVDYFIIVEAGQTFSGNKKPFNYELNIERFHEFNHKIIYFKIEDFHDSYDSVKAFLYNHEDISFRNIFDLLESETHYPKDELHWVLDSYHRNCLQIVHQKHIKDNDFIILSDLDEIPSLEYLEINFLNTLSSLMVMKQKQFMYYLNYYHNDNWYGSIVGKYEHFKDISLNIIKADSKITRQIVDEDELKNGGYHFTNAGGTDLIISKIQSWSHQEFNTKDILKRLNYNVSTGQDIFERQYGTILKSVEVNDKNFFDKEMGDLLIRYPSLLINKKTRIVSKYSWYNCFRYFKYVLDKVINYLKQ
jgi:beta-1,4-mannosyl-glycoprotein beta-1,4-N-acetylglucosaminyltransferase